MVRRNCRLRVSDILLKATILVAGLFILLSVSATLVQAGNYFRYDEDVQGKVIDADTRQPLAGVVVMAMWVTEHTRITIEPEERYYDYFETLTNENGEFTIPEDRGPSPGTYNVEIRSYQPTGEKAADPDFPGKMEELTRNVVPKRYNDATTLQEEIKAEGPNRFEFTLQSR